MNTPVSFPVAKLLKEKSFVMPTFYYYENEKLIEPYLENGSSTDTDFRVYLSDLKEHFNKWSKNLVSAPTIADVVMWLYEKHGIWISSDFSEVDESFTYKIHLINSDNLPRIFTDCGYNSPTEAYEAAITYTLNNLM